MMCIHGSSWIRTMVKLLLIYCCYHQGMAIITELLIWDRGHCCVWLMRESISLSHLSSVTDRASDDTQADLSLHDFRWHFFSGFLNFSGAKRIIPTHMSTHMIRPELPQRSRWLGLYSLHSLLHELQSHFTKPFLEACQTVL